MLGLIIHGSIMSWRLNNGLSWLSLM